MITLVTGCSWLESPNNTDPSVETYVNEGTTLPTESTVGFVPSPTRPVDTQEEDVEIPECDYRAALICRKTAVESESGFYELWVALELLSPQWRIHSYKFIDNSTGTDLVAAVPARMGGVDVDIYGGCVCATDHMSNLGTKHSSYERDCGLYVFRIASAEEINFENLEFTAGLDYSIEGCYKTDAYYGRIEFNSVIGDITTVQPIVHNNTLVCIDGKYYIFHCSEGSIGSSAGSEYYYGYGVTCISGSLKDLVESLSGHTRLVYSYIKDEYGWGESGYTGDGDYLRDVVTPEGCQVYIAESEYHNEIYIGYCGENLTREVKDKVLSSMIAYDYEVDGETRTMFITRSR
jgi:hypothetical protein